MINPVSLPRPFINEVELQAILGGTPDSRYGKVKRLLAQGKLLHIRRGLYALTEEGGCQEKILPYALAPFIYGPSYISLESAFSFHGLIPEAVYTTTSVCTKRSKEFTTPLGIFSFEALPSLNFFTQVNLIHENNQSFFMAKPWKAICDYVYCYKKEWTNREPLIDSLRIEPDFLPILRPEEAQELEEYYHRRRLSKFLRGVV